MSKFNSNPYKQINFHVASKSATKVRKGRKIPKIHVTLFGATKCERVNALKGDCIVSRWLLFFR